MTSTRMVPFLSPWTMPWHLGEMPAVDRSMYYTPLSTIVGLGRSLQTLRGYNRLRVVMDRAVCRSLVSSAVGFPV
jgi:hypothetical protein